ncbi:MAG: hypothetical protein CM1200mP41_30330 [Gammaproteobacteria bacterium]|nr:MAG: hypothetical protein CM1200mP41_30330 [Gammaproteobacteria bacterium]
MYFLFPIALGIDGRLFLLSRKWSFWPIGIGQWRRQFISCYQSHGDPQRFITTIRYQQDGIWCGVYYRECRVALVAV